MEEKELAVIYLQQLLRGKAIHNMVSKIPFGFILQVTSRVSRVGQKTTLLVLPYLVHIFWLIGCI